MAKKYYDAHPKSLKINEGIESHTSDHNHMPQCKSPEFISEYNLPKVTLWLWVAMLVRTLMISVNRD